MKLTEKEIIYLKAIPKSNFNDGSDAYCGLWSWSITDEIKEFSVQQAKGVMSSLVKKGLIRVNDAEGYGRADDMCVDVTDKGRETIKTLLFTGKVSGG